MTDDLEAEVAELERFYDGRLVRAGRYFNDRRVVRALIADWRKRGEQIEELEADFEVATKIAEQRGDLMESAKNENSTLRARIAELEAEVRKWYDDWSTAAARLVMVEQAVVALEAQAKEDEAAMEQHKHERFPADCSVCVRLTDRERGGNANTSGVSTGCIPMSIARSASQASNASGRGSR